MKKYFFSLAILFLTISNAFTQSDCKAILERKFGGIAYSYSTPKVLNKLGTSPQFNEIPKHDANSAYNHLKSIHQRKVKGSHIELDQLLQLLGYSGFKDPSFNSSRIIPEILRAGTTGMMGRYSSGHKYSYSTLGLDFPAYKILSSSGDCFIYIMKKCGNAFYVPDPCTLNPQNCDPCKWKPESCDSCKINPLKCIPKPQVTCVSQEVNLSASGKIESSDVFNTKETTTIIGNFNGKTVNLGSYPISVRTMYDYVVNASSASAKSYKVAKVGNEMIAPVSMNVPVALGFNIAQQKVQIGNNGNIVLNLDEKSFKVLSSVFKSSTSGTASASAVDFDSFVKKTESKTTQTMSDSKVLSKGEKSSRQFVEFMSGSNVKDGAVKASEQMVKILGVYRKTGKLAKGESAEKYLCLGSFSVPVKQGIQYDLTSKMNVGTTLDICDENGMQVTQKNVDVPVKVDYKITKEEVMIGDAGNIVISLSDAQYKKLSKKYGRCCDGKACD